jgi:hypothetical protein
VVTADAAGAFSRRGDGVTTICGRARIPAHVTILFPLVPAADVDGPCSPASPSSMPVEAFNFELARLDSFPGRRVAPPGAGGARFTL